MNLGWVDFITVVSASLIPSLTTAIIAIIRAVKADSKANANTEAINGVATDVTKIADCTPNVDGSTLTSTKIVNGGNEGKIP